MRKQVGNHCCSEAVIAVPAETGSHTPGGHPHKYAN
jgi:hypothetical protein